MHTTDELPVHPVDVTMGHHFTSTYPTTHFRHGLMVNKHGAGRHTAVSTDAVTFRRPGEPTEHRDLRDGELEQLLHELEVPLTSDEERRLIEVVAGLRPPG
jgi:N-hydroxyarylamine O-acetyltransferase